MQGLVSSVYFRDSNFQIDVFAQSEKANTGTIKGMTRMQTTGFDAAFIQQSIIIDRLIFYIKNPPTQMISCVQVLFTLEKTVHATMN